MPRPASQRRLTANRQNARKSTGPNTPAGNARSARNALKHALLSCLSAYSSFILHPSDPRNQKKSCQTNPSFRPGAIENADSRAKTNPKRTQTNPIKHPKTPKRTQNEPKRTQRPNRSRSVSCMQMTAYHSCVSAPAASCRGCSTTPTVPRSVQVGWARPTNLAWL